MSICLSGGSEIWWEIDATLALLQYVHTVDLEPLGPNIASWPIGSFKFGASMVAKPSVIPP